MTADRASPDLEEARARARVRSSLFGTPAEPVRIGRFVLLDKLGAGAMGVVHAAYDPQLDRKIAIKLLRPDITDAHRGAERLFSEAKAMAKLSHPNVVSVYEIGAFEGHVFIAMEFVDGATLRRWRDAEKRTMDELLSALLAAGEGLQGAHDAGLLHGDFKPDNVLLDTTGRVRVADFGLAQRFDGDDTTTGFGEVTTSTVVGTPAYMAPEQFDGRSEKRSDQFAFCVTAYEALYGARPFVGDTWRQLLDNILARRMSPTPSQSSVPRRVRAALLRGLSPDPDERFDSMRDLLDALGRRRRGRRVLPVVGLITVGVVASAMLFGADARDPCANVGATVDRIWDPSRRERIRSVLLATGVSFAPATFESVAAAMDRYADQWRSMAAEACRATHVEQSQSDAVLTTRMLCLEERVQELRALIGGLEQVDASTIEHVPNAPSLLTSISVCADLAHLKQRIAPPVDPERRRRVESLEAKLLDVRSLFVLSRYADGITLARTVYDEATALGHEPLQAAAATRLGWLEVYTGDLESAERHLHEGARRGLKTGHVMAMVEAWDMLTFVTASLHSNFEGALNLSGYAVAMTAQLTGREGTVAAIFGRRAWLYGQMGRLEESLADNERAIVIRRATLGDDHPQTGYSYFFIGQVLLFAGRYEDANTHFEKAEAIFRKAFSEDHEIVIRSIHDRGFSYFKMNQPALAVPMIEDAIERYLRKNPDDLSVAYAQLDLARVYLATDRPELARPLVAAGVERFRKKRGEESLSFADAAVPLAKLQLADGQLDVAALTLEHSVAVFEAVLHQDTYRQLEALETLGVVHTRRRRYREAVVYLERALAVYDRQLGVDHPSSEPTLETLTEAFRALHDESKAARYADRAARVRRLRSTR